jgi:hypothetical protein
MAGYSAHNFCRKCYDASECGIRQPPPPVRPPLDGIVEPYIKKANELLRMFFRRIRMGGDATPLTPALHIVQSQDHGHDGRRMVFGRELCVPCKLLFGVAPDVEQAMTSYMMKVLERFH